MRPPSTFAGAGSAAGGEPHNAPPNVPRLPRTYLARVGLWQKIDRATAGAVTLLVAPPGAGKTLGVAGWVRTAARRGSAGPVHWVEGDASWSAPRIADLLDRAAGKADPDGEDAGVPDLVVIDDAHRLPCSAVELIDERLRTAPETIRLLLISQWDLPLTRLVPEMLGHFTMLHGSLLRMSGEEAATLVASHAQTTDPDVVRSIVSHAQGWAAVLVLTARAIAAQPDPRATAERFRRDSAHPGDQMADEVFGSLAPRERHLLLCVGTEEVVSASTAKHLTHDAAAGDILGALETSGLLVTRLSDPDTDGLDPDDARYRIHPLLADVIRRRIAVGGVDVARARSTVARAVRIDIARGDTSRSFDRLISVAEPNAAAELLATEGIEIVGRDGGFRIAEFVRRFPGSIAAHPQAWFAVACERWFAGDVVASRHWLDQVLMTAFGPDPLPETEVACARMMRARLGLEPIADAVANAIRVVAQAQGPPPIGVGVAVSPFAGSGATIPVLLTELGICQNWLGDLSRAEVNLTMAIGLFHSRGLVAFAASAKSHLAFTEYMQGREHICRRAADETIALLASGTTPLERFAIARAELALALAGMMDLPHRVMRMQRLLAGGPDEGVEVHPADLCTRYWVRMREARIAMVRGSVVEAERILDMPLKLPVAEALPAHLTVALAVERAVYANLSYEDLTLRQLSESLGTIGAAAAEAFVDGLRADLRGDPRAAVAAFRKAAERPSHPQPPIRAMALVCVAQLLDALGEEPDALASLKEAVTITDVRRNATPFYGWSRHGATVESLLDRLDARCSTPWLKEILASVAGQAGAVAHFAATTATPREREQARSSGQSISLSPRERAVLNELARGATYADVAAALFVSENTVKTHVSSIYLKLSVSRRSDALAVARTRNLI
ncbi:LuxR C-terminal-related transcriptional regulator [Nocardioides sp. GXZ039]|uniref:LuxR C-terminal-related transcriptional regulator n=1 Tax=Nocardioides sp. GXZ039 TaxID=3136018 RepID=UPI0030F43AE2